MGDNGGGGGELSPNYLCVTSQMRASGSSEPHHPGEMLPTSAEISLSFFLAFALNPTH